MAASISAERKARIAAQLQDGWSIDDLRIIDTELQLQTADSLDLADEAVIAEVTKQAGPQFINDERKPTVMKIVMWMCHGDVVNLNGDAFVGAELEKLAGSLFRAPNFGVMDWNHAAMLSWKDDPPLIGVWYKADWAYDAKAANGKGAYGLLVTGVMFSWLFPEQANSLLADQARDGTIKGSMACVPSSIEFGDMNGERCAILHNPIFFTNSLLDVPPADPDAKGLASESPQVQEHELAAPLLGLSATTIATTTASAGPTSITFDLGITTTDASDTTVLYWLANDATGRWTLIPSDTPRDTVLVPGTEPIPARLAMPTEDAMDLETLQAQVAAAEATVADLTTKLEAMASLETELTTVKARLVELETAANEQQSARDGLATELATAQARIVEVEAELETAKNRVAEFEAAAAEKATAERLATRKAELPEAYLAAHDKRDEEQKTQIETIWAGLDDAAWQLKKVELSGGFPIKVGYSRRSAEQGVLPSLGSNTEDLISDLQSRIKRSK